MPKSAPSATKQPQHLPLSAFPKSFRPLENKVALRRHKKDLMAPGSSLLFRPEQRLKNSKTADVLAVGRKCKLGLKPGDVVVITDFAASDREYDGERLLIVPEDDILAVDESPGPRR